MASFQIEGNKQAAAEAHANGANCLCELCNCGRHHCPKDPKHTQHYDHLQTNYQDTYTGKTGERMKSQKPPSNYRPGGKFEGNSTQQADFKPLPYGRVPIMRPKQTKITGQPFQGKTMYSESYMGVKGEQPKPHIMKSNLHTGGTRFDGNSTQQRDYVPHSLSGRQAPFKPHDNQTGHVEDRDFHTEKSSNYVANSVGPRQKSYAPKNTTEFGKPFYGRSTQQHDFVPHSRSGRQAPFKPRNNQEDVGEDRDFRTEKASNFTAKSAGPRLASFKPKNTTVTGTKFQGRSTQQADFVPHRGDARQAPFRPHDHQHAENEDRDFQTEKTANYIPKQGARMKSYKPKPGLRNNERFDGRTTHGSDFLPHQGHEHPKAFRPENNLKQSREDRDFSTAANNDYVAYDPNAQRNARAPAFRPRDNGLGDDRDGRQWDTEQTRNYTKKNVPHCVAGDMQQSGKYPTKLTNGHVYYQQTKRDGHWTPVPNQRTQILKK